jgi:endonuclease/exonuclease/phosphatase family metal-dependent hydrolase
MEVRVRIRRVVAVLVALVLVPLVARPAAAAADVTVTAWQWNIAGWVMHRGSTTDGLIPALTASIKHRNATFVVLNEVCWSQYKAVQADLAASGWPQSTDNFSRFEPQLSTVCNGDPFGVAMFSKLPLGSADRTALTADPADNGEIRKLLCAPVSGEPLRFCATHLSPHSMVNTQLNEVRAKVEGYEDAGETVVTAGDFNTEPSYDRLNSWYAASADTTVNPGNWGRHRELDDTDPVCLGYGEGTTNRTDNGACGKGSKIDLIFVPENKIVGSYSGDSLTISTDCGGPCSDHRIFYGTFTVSVG